MIKSTVKKLGVLSAIALSTSAFAQTIFFNNGGTVFVANGAVMQVNGGFQNDGAAAAITNDGTINIANSGTPGTVFLTNSSVMQGNGQYFVEQDWSNSATFNAGTSTVTLNGNLQQFITTTNATVTTFNNLVLTGTGTGANKKKTLQGVNANIGTNGTLTINNRELETLTNTMFVLNPATTCVTNTTTPGNEGFVSSSVGGRLSRATNVSSAYLFPTGSSVGTVRYRPLIITPSAAAANTFTARLGNNNATTDGFNTASLDNTMCQVNNLYYHEVNRSAGSSNANIDIFFDPVADGGWDGMAQWNTPTAALWNNMGTVTVTPGVPLSDVLKVNWSDFSNSPYALARVKPNTPTFACNDVCANSSGVSYNATGSSGTYTWTVPAGSTITSGQGTSAINVNWGSTSGPVTVTASSALGCASNPASCSVTVNPVPVANFDTVANGFDISFTDLSTGPATSWSWNFGDGTGSTLQNPTHTFTSNGTYNVCLTTSNNGCDNTLCYTVNVDGTVSVVIPNVFTPDNDGINDLYFITCMGIKEYKLEIYDRWGLKVFSSEVQGEKWDGRTTSGVPVTDGTYYFILKAIAVTTKDYSTKGYIQLIRK